jgi:E3 ubiquitin-protein ligase MYCBP2
MANNRIRCNECNKNFCIKCKAEPYHVGKTCEESKNNAICRFCNEKLTQPSPSMKAAFKDVCRKNECFDLMQASCDKLLPCGHPCCGTKGEKKCMPCLEPECIEKMPENKRPKENKEDYCNICYCSGLGQEPCVHLECGHIFHINCVKTLV